MKKITIIGILSLCAAGVYAQGTLYFYNNTGVGGLVTHIYSPDPSNPTLVKQGDTSAEITASGYDGAGVYGSVAAAAAAINPTGVPVTYGGTPIGGASYVGTPGVAPAAPVSTLYSYGNLFTVEVYALAAGSSAQGTSTYTLYENAGGTEATGASVLPAFSSLQPVSQYTSTLSTATGAGGFIVSPVFTAQNPDPGIPGTGYLGNGLPAQKHPQYIGNNASVALACWYNANNTINSLSAAQDAGVPSGESAVFMDGGLGEPSSVNTAGGNGSTATQPTDMSNVGFGGLTSFNIAPVPEPATIALGVMGACAFLARRRKK